MYENLSTPVTKPKLVSRFGARLVLPFITASCMVSSLFCADVVMTIARLDTNKIVFIFLFIQF